MSEVLTIEGRPGQDTKAPRGIMETVAHHIKKRWPFVRDEANNLVSFVAVVYEYYASNHPLSWFFALGVLLVFADVIFLWGQIVKRSGTSSSVLPRAKGVPSVAAMETIRKAKFHFLRLSHMDWLDDLLSDLPQSLWIAYYCKFYSFSTLGAVNAVYAASRILEDITGANGNPEPDDGVP
eukprot:m.204415 g.204415  ORF g.204415 m.204415 type:complete len:180 (-) comp18469_c1_seq1:41-580(-)